MWLLLYWPRLVSAVWHYIIQSGCWHRSVDRRLQASAHSGHAASWIATKTSIWKGGWVSSCNKDWSKNIINLKWKLWTDFHLTSLITFSLSCLWAVLAEKCWCVRSAKSAVYLKISNLIFSDLFRGNLFLYFFSTNLREYFFSLEGPIYELSGNCILLKWWYP